jgi:hypothetical protein
MAVRYTLTDALLLDCNFILSEIETYNEVIIPTLTAELNASISSNDSFRQEQLRNELTDLQTDLSNLETASSQLGCGVTIGGGGTSTPEAKIEVSNTIDFSSLDINKSTTKTFTIRNTGTADLIIDSYFISPQSNVFTPVNWPAINPSSRYTIPIGRQLDLQVRFSPSAVGSFTTSIVFYSNSVGGTNTVVLRGVGQQPQDPGINSPLGRKATGSVRYFSLRNVREIYTETSNNPDINSPYFDSRKTKHSAKIIADIYQCYTKPNAQNGATTQTMVMDNVVIANGVGSFWYEDCDDFLGGLLPVYQYYYDNSKFNDIREWRKLDPGSIPIQIFSDTSLEAINAANFANLIPTAGQLLKAKQTITAIADEIDDGTAYWGEFDSNNPNTTSCNRFSKANTLYLDTVITSKLTGKSQIKIYDGRSDQRQIRSTTTRASKPDLLSKISGVPERTLPYAYISNVVYGRLSCLSPNTGCFITDERPMTGPNDIRPIGEQIIKLAKNGRSAVPEQIPSDPCYRGFKTKYIKGYVHERKWAVQLNCLGKIFPEFEWRVDESLFEQNGQEMMVWEDVAFAGTEIGFNDVCIPNELAKEQEPYVDASDIRGCYEIHTLKIFNKYPDYSIPGMDDYIKGPETLTTEDYSGLGPGIKLSRKVQRADCIDTPLRVYHPLIKGKDIMAARDILVTKGLFNHTQSLLSYNTSSVQPLNSKKYYYDVVDETRIVNGTPVAYFSVAYGNKYGSGSLYEGYEFNDSPSRAIYGQYRLLALDQSETEFKFYTNGTYGSTRKDIYAISFNRDSLTDRIDPGNFELSLYGGGNTLTLIDNSKDMLEDKFSNQYVHTYFDIVSGSLSDGIHSSGTGSIETNKNITTYGRVYPNLGFIVLDAEKLDDEISLGTNLGDNVDGDNSYRLFTAISGAASLGNPLKARSSKNKKTNHYFVRVGAATSNYTNNPTVIDEMVTGSRYIKNEYFRHRPTTYVTTVGLYNDMNELLAVAKLSKPILKTPDKDILIKIRLNW